MDKGSKGVRISSSAQSKPVPVAGFIKNKKNSVSSVSKVSQYRKPEIVRAQSGWYIKYYYRIPVQVRKFYNGKEWYRFRVKEDINRRRGEERETYAEWLRSQIEESLIKGYNPFEPEQEYVNSEDMEVSDELGAKDAVLLFLEAWRKRGLKKASTIKYERTAKRLIEWLEIKRMPYKDIREITHENIEQFLNDLKNEKNFSNREFNNTLGFTSTIFNFLLKKKYIDSSPCADFKKQPTVARKHRYFDKVKMEKLFKIMEVKDPYLKVACEVVYYACIRSEMELKYLKVQNILWDENKIFAEKSKGDRERYIPMDDNLKELLLKRVIDKYPGNYYVFGIGAEPAPQPFGAGFFSKRFRKVRDLAELDSNYTIYGFKHTRVIDLNNAGASDADIMSLTGHTDYSSFCRYMRDLGLTADVERLNKLSRKI